MTGLRKWLRVVFAGRAVAVLLSASSQLAAPPVSSGSISGISLRAARRPELAEARAP